MASNIALHLLRLLIIGNWTSQLLRLTFPRAKLRRQMFMTWRNSGRRIGRNFGQTFLGIFVLHVLCRTTHRNFSPHSSPFITPCLVTAPVVEISKFHLRELLGLGAPNSCQRPRVRQDNDKIGILGRFVPSLFAFDRECPYVFVHRFSCRHLAQFGLRRLGLPLPNLLGRHVCRTKLPPKKI